MCVQCTCHAVTVLLNDMENMRKYYKLEGILAIIAHQSVLYSQMNKMKIYGFNINSAGRNVEINSWEEREHNAFVKISVYSQFVFVLARKLKRSSAKLI